MNKEYDNRSILTKSFEFFIFEGRWAIAPMYLGLIVAIVIYTYKFLTQLYELCINLFHTSEAELMLGVLSLVDITMVGNLIVMIIIGSYSIFIRRLPNFFEKPQWLEHISSGTLKVKMATSLIGVSSIHLLKDFINAENVDWQIVFKHGTIHLIFLLSTIALVIADQKGHAQTTKH